MLSPIQKEIVELPGNLIVRASAGIVAQLSRQKSKIFIMN